MDLPLLLPHKEDLIIPTHPKGMPAVLHQLAAWHISGNASKAKAFLKKAQSCIFHHRDRSLQDLMTLYSESELTGVINGILILFHNFLAHLFKEGYQYCSLSTYHSATSSVHEKADGYEVGQHPLVSTLLKGLFNQ